MDGRKNSRSHHGTAEGLKVKVKSSRATPTLVLTEDRKGSIYEINIHSSFDFHRNMEEGDDFPKKDPAKVSFARASVVSPGVESEENSKDCRLLENPLMKSHCAAFHHPQTEGKSIPLNAEKIQTALKLEGKGLEEKKAKAPLKKPEKENQSLLDSDNLKDLGRRKECDGTFKQRMKNFIIENFISKDDDAMKALFKNFCERMDNDQLHLHHHEHHHHYYFDNSAILDEKESESLPSSRGFPEYRKVSSALGRKINRDSKSPKGEEQVADKQQTKQTYYFKCPGESNMTFTKTSSGKIKPETNELLKVDKTCKIKGKRSSGVFPGSRSKFSTSAESILNKKSDFITTHIYSDTELTKCDSVMMQVGELSDIGSNKSKELKRNAAEEYCSLVNSLKSFNHFMSPVVITDQKTTPKISYVKCECALKGSNTITSSERNRSQGKARFNEGKTNGYENSKKETEIRNSQDAAGKGKQPGQSQNDIWTVKLKSELTEIKKELKRIEEKDLQKRKPMSSLFNNKEPTENSESTHKISVYSGKTFIFGAENVFVAQKTDPK